MAHMRATPKRPRLSSTPAAIRNARRRDEMRRAGLCTECGATAEQPFVLCSGCRQDACKRTAMRRAK